MSDYEAGYEAGQEPGSRPHPDVADEAAFWRGFDDARREAELRRLDDYEHGYRAGLDLPADAIIDPDAHEVQSFEAWELGVRDGRKSKAD